MMLALWFQRWEVRSLEKLSETVKGKDDENVGSVAG